MGDLLGIVNHGLFIHAHVLLGKPISGKIEWCHCLENMKEVLQDPIILEHRFLSPGVRFCHVKKIPMVICWVRLPNDKPRQMTKFNNIYIFIERESERERDLMLLEFVLDENGSLITTLRRGRHCK
jgi:hypothetical protein